MIIVDIETSGIDPRTTSILSIGAVNFARPTQQFYDECRAFDGAEITDEALAVNGFTREQTTDAQKKSESELVITFFHWLYEQKDTIIAGENISFDYSFLREASKRAGVTFPISRRTVDLHSLSFAEHLKKGIGLPTKEGVPALSLDATLAYLGLSPEPKPHNALTGAMLEAEAFSQLIYGKGLDVAD